MLLMAGTMKVCGVHIGPRYTRIQEYKNTKLYCTMPVRVYVGLFTFCALLICVFVSYANVFGSHDFNGKKYVQSYLDIRPPFLEETNTSAPYRYHVTLVSAYIDIGEFGKRNSADKRDHNIYEKWSEPYSRIVAPLVFFTDSLSFAEHMRHVRRDLPDLTRVVLVNSSDLFAFSLRSRIAEVYSGKFGSYPRHWPNTVYPDYTCLTHAKFDFVMDTLDKAHFPFHTPYVAWMDVGYLREIVEGPQNTVYHAWPPADLDRKRVLFGQIGKPDFNQRWQDIFRGNMNWVAGGFFLATPDVMRTFVTQYRRAVTSFLDFHESNVEQHVLYAMYTHSGRTVVKPDLELQVEHSNDWFHMGFKCLHPSTTIDSTVVTRGPPS